MERKFRKAIKSLNDVFNFVSEFVDVHKVNREFIYPISLAIEEIFVNMVKYNTETKDDILISIDIKGKMLAICLVDRNVHSFDVTKSEVVDVDRPIHERKSGGLGLHLVRSLMDDVRYEYADGSSKILLLKRLEA